jgi:hypothetical protein
MLEAVDPAHYLEYVTFISFLHVPTSKVAHLSGAAACIDKFYRDMDDSTTLDPNGT